MRTGYEIRAGSAMIAARIGDDVTTTHLTLCPRCEVHHFTPRAVRLAEVGEDAIREHPWPALSRVANIDICSPCGQDEAMRDFTGAAPIPSYEWPIMHEPVLLDD